MALEGISSSEMNNLLKDPRFSRSLLKSADPRAYRKIEREEDRMNVLQRIGELFSFDEWTDDAVRAMRKWHDPKTGKLTPIRGAIGGITMPLDFLVSGARKIAGAATGSKRVSNYESPRGKDILPQISSDIYSIMKPKDYQRIVQTHGQDLDYGTLMEEMGTPKYMQGINKVTAGVTGLAFDTALTPSFWLSGATTAAGKKAGVGEKIIRQGTKGTTLQRMAKEAPEQATKLAGTALQGSGLQPTPENIAKVLESSSFLRSATKEAMEPGLYAVGPLSKNATLIKGGKNMDVVARYLDNPLFAALGDVWGKVKGIPMGELADGNPATIGKNVDDIVDAVKQKLQYNYALKKYGGDKVAYHFDALNRDLNAGDYYSEIRKASVKRHTSALKELGIEDDFLKPENLRALREYMVGSPQSTDLGQLIKNLPEMSPEQKELFWESLGRQKGKGVEQAGAGKVFKSSGKVDLGQADIPFKYYKPGLGDTSKEIDKIVKQGYSEEVAEAAVLNPTGFEKYLNNEFEKAYYQKYAESIRGWARKQLAKEKALSGDISAENFWINKSKSGKTTYYKPKDLNKLIKENLKNVSDQEVEELAQKVFEKDFPGAKLSEVSSGSFDPVENILKNNGLKGEDALMFKDEANFSGLAEELSDRYGYLAEESNRISYTASDVRTSLAEEISALERSLKNAKNPDDIFFLKEELSHSRQLAAANDLIDEFGFNRARRYITELSEDADEQWLLDQATRGIKVTQEADEFGGAKFLSSSAENITDTRTGWQKYLDLAKSRSVQAIKKAQERAVKQDLVSELVESSTPKSVDDKIKAFKEAEEAVNAAVRGSSVDTGGILTGPEEMVSTAIGKSTKVAEIDPAVLKSALEQAGFRGPGAKRIVDAVAGFREELAREEQLMVEFQDWLTKSVTPDTQKQELVERLTRIQESYKLDFSDPKNRKTVLKDVLQLEKDLDKVGQIDAQSRTIADYFKETLIRPMKSHADGYVLREQYGLNNLGYLGVGHRTMDVAQEESPGFGKLITEAERKIFNEATAQAYNRVVGDDAYKLKTDFESFANDVIGHQAKQDRRLFSLHKNMTNLLETVKKGEAGDNIMLFPKGSEVNLEEWKLVKDVPGLDGANMYVKKELAPEFDRLAKFYKRAELKGIMKYARFFNNVWKGIQTGGGANLPKITGKIAEEGRKLGLGKFIDYYNSNMAFLPLSHAFTSRNILGNLTGTKLVTDIPFNEVGPYLGRAVDVQKLVKASMGETDMNQGLWGILKGDYSPEKMSALVKELQDSGILETSYRAQEFIPSGDIVQGASELGQGGKVLGNITKGLVESRSMSYNESMEQLWKIAVFLYERDSGKSVGDAAQSSFKALFDYSALTPFEKEYIKPYTVFYTWTKKNVELMADIAMNKPQAFKAYSKLLLEPSQQLSNATEEERELLPDWTESVIGIPVKSGDELKFLSGYGGNLEALSDWIGSGGTDVFGGASETAQKALDMVAPTFKLPINMLVTKRNTFKNMPIEEDTSAYGYRALPGFMKKALGVTERKWVDRKGGTGTTYEMDGNKKYLIESSLGRATSVPLKVLSAASGEDKPIASAMDLMFGAKTSRYDVEYLKYRAEKERYEMLMKEFKRLGLVSQYTGYGYNSAGAQLNEPNIQDYINKARL